MFTPEKWIKHTETIARALERHPYLGIRALAQLRNDEYFRFMLKYQHDPASPHFQSYRAWVRIAENVSPAVVKAHDEVKDFNYASFDARVRQIAVFYTAGARNPW
jgi:hypothetical protein